MNLCKPLNPVSFIGNISRSWKYFVKKTILVVGREKTPSKSGKTKIRIMLSHAGKEAREKCTKCFHGLLREIRKSLIVTKAFQAYCKPQKMFCMSIIASGT